MAVTDWVSNMFQSEQTRGLSGGSASAVALDDANPYYNYRLRRHQAEGDLVADPALLWYTSAYVKTRGGLATHITSEKGEGIAAFTDVLLVLSLEDYSRASQDAGGAWLEGAMNMLRRELDDFGAKEGFARRFAHRPFGFRVLCDGSADMGGQALGLRVGEFVTGLLPNLYTGPVSGSLPLLGVHVNLPGVWEGYQEVGRLHNDQILFTIGAHWLDNFTHPALREAALYRLQRDADGSFFHIINPDLQDRYDISDAEQDGASVITIFARDDGEPLAYLVLAQIDPSQVAEGRPGIDMPDSEGPSTIPPPMLIDDRVQPVGGSLLGSRTIIPDAPNERIFTLQERGALLQKVHFANFMEGYDVYVGTRGELGTVVEEKAATFQVRKKKVSLVAHVDGVTVGGHPVGPGVELQLDGDALVEVAGQRFEYRDLRGMRVDGWPYVGEIRRPASSNYMIWGDVFRVGRSRECRVVLPDEPRNDNIAWKPAVGDGATIRARTGDIPKSRFYTDSIMVASEHAAVDLSGADPQIVCQARHCYVYVRRAGEVMPLYPTTSGRTPTSAAMEPGDEILIGNCLFHVGYTPKEAGMAPAPAPKIVLSSDMLVDAVSNPDFDRLEAPSDPDEPQPRRGRRRRRRPEPDELAPAAGLGEKGTAPQPVPVERVGMDSILGVYTEDPTE